jgi:hypothetical protein
MDDSSIAGRTATLRREIGLIQQTELHYRSQPRRSLADKESHTKRKLRILQIREELRTLFERARQR